MPTNYTGRVILILTVLILSLLAIFPPGSLFDPKLSFGEKLALKPGIDMVGGTSLLYEIKPPESGGTVQGNLAEQVMDSLKKRVDPDGLRNLIWRPQGSTRLEIQMSMSDKNKQSEPIRKAILDDLGRGVTVYRARGGKSGDDREILYCVVTRLEIGRVMRIVQLWDETAFVIQHPLADVRGGVVHRHALP